MKLAGSPAGTLYLGREGSTNRRELARSGQNYSLAAPTAQPLISRITPICSKNAAPSNDSAIFYYLKLMQGVVSCPFR